MSLGVKFIVVLCALPLAADPKDDVCRELTYQNPKAELSEGECLNAMRSLLPRIASENEGWQVRVYRCEEIDLEA